MPDMFSLVIPVYKNEVSLERLLSEIVNLCRRLPGELEVVFVVDGSPDRSDQVLRRLLPGLPVRSRLLLLSRNFGSFAAISAGLAAAQGDYFAVMAADLQDPPELAERFFESLRQDEADIVFGVRSGRGDPLLTVLTSNLFWALYRAFVIPEMPKGGIDVFGCNRTARDCLLRFPEAQTNLIALLFWMGYRRRYFEYRRQPRTAGKSAWTLGKKIRYFLDSIFNFTDLPVKLLLYLGTVALVLSLAVAFIVVSAKLLGNIAVPGYVPTVLAILSFGSLLSLGLGILGQYLWLTLQNARGRPAYIVSEQATFDKRSDS